MARDDYRDRRRGSGFDQPPPDLWGAERRPARPSSRPPMNSGPTRDADGRVKWFNPEKGFGFIELTDGGEAFLHVRAVEAAGHSTLEPGTTVAVRLRPSPKGEQVAEIVSVDTSTAEAPAPRAPRSGGFGDRPGGGFGDRSGGFGGPRPPRPAPRPGPAPVLDGPEQTGAVKWYNAAKGFGFIAPDDGSSDLFVHRTVLERSGLYDLREGQRVRFHVVEGRKGLEAGSITPDE
jgi:cold shock protein